MKKILMLAALAGVFSITAVPTANAAPLCTSGSTLTALSGGVCQFGNFYLEFLNVSISASGASVINNPGANVSAINAATLVTLSSSGAENLVVSFLANSASKSFDSSGNGSATFNFSYYVTPIPMYGIVNVDYTIQNAYASGPAYEFAISGFKQLVSTPYQAQAGQITAQDTFENLTGALSFPATAGRVLIQDSLTLNTSSSTSSKVGDATHQGALINSLTFAPVPEPVTVILSGAGLMALGLLRRRTRRTE